MRVMLENIHQQSMSIAQHLHTWLLIGQHVKSSGCFLVRRDYIWFCPRQLFKQINNYQTVALYLPHHKPLTWRRTILIWAHWIYSISPGDVPGSILVTVKCLSFFHRVFFFFLVNFLIDAVLFSSHARNERGMQTESTRKEQGQFQTAQRPGSELMCSFRENHMPWE